MQFTDDTNVEGIEIVCKLTASLRTVSKSRTTLSGATNERELEPIQANTNRNLPKLYCE